MGAEWRDVAYDTLRAAGEMLGSCRSATGKLATTATLLLTAVLSDACLLSTGESRHRKGAIGMVSSNLPSPVIT